MVRAGYKQTEIGTIPEDWGVFNLGEHSLKVGSGITPKGGASVYKKFGRPFVRSQNVGWGKLRLKDLAYIDDQTHETFPASELKSDDVLLNISGASIGRCSMASFELAGGNVNQHVCIIRTNSKIDRKLLSYSLLSKYGQDQIDSFQTGGNRQGLNFGQIRSLQFAYPYSSKEQKAIAEALSDVDALIESLEKLISKKRAIKTATMQELVTGERKLNGFSNSRRSINIGKDTILKARIGWQALTTAEYLDSGDYLLVTGTEFSNGKILWSKCHAVSKWRYNQDRNIQLQNEDVLVTKDGTIGKVGYVHEVTKPATLNSGVFVIRPNSNKITNRYLYYVLRSRIFDNFLNKITAGSTITHLYQKDFVTFDFDVPEDPEEQKAISRILTDMDNEIFELDERLTTTRNLKQGMMQELLTGRTRLVS